MSIPAFVDRLNVSVQKTVGRAFFTEPISLRSTTVVKTIGVDPDAIAPADAGFIILANASIYVRDGAAVTHRASDFLAGAAQKQVIATGSDVDVSLPVGDTASAIFVSRTPVIFADPAPQTVFWS